MKQTGCSTPHAALNHFFNLYKNNNELQTCYLQLDSAKSPEELISVYTQTLPLIEKIMWQKGINDSALEYYQQLFHEMESFIPHNEDKLRHQFIVAIPVADRPQHLDTCLLSLLNICKVYNYGGFEGEKYRKVRALIADDSKYEKSRLKHREIAHKYTEKGLEVIYFGQDEQKKIVDKYNLNKILKRTESDSFYHKGASTTRNISYLKLREITRDNEKTLFYFIDSDQEFKISTPFKKTDKNLYAINYFFYLNQIFSSKNINILTGKVVGDPPVSPSVMTANFLNDLIDFITRISVTQPEKTCLFHKENNDRRPDDASYHDMADLFGFSVSEKTPPYNCPLGGEHNHAHCFTDLSTRLSQFFDGAHPTRKTSYAYENVLQSIMPARTIYTGNYIFNQQGLKYFIPFADLKLRMAGPTLGRIIKANIDNQFISANLPPGVNRSSTNDNENKIDLSIEFGRQFFGDVMLFSIEKLIEAGYPEASIKPEIISDTVKNTINSMLDKYNIKHNEIKLRIDVLRKRLNDKKHWWNHRSDMQISINLFTDFISNIECNFGSNATAYEFINSEENINTYQKKISSAIATYNTDMEIWQEIIR